MVEDDQEILDWGNEDDELQAVDSNIVSQLKQPADGRNGEQEDDAVSLGDDEDEDIYTYRPTSQDDTATNPPSTPHGSNSQHNGTNRGHDIYRESSITSQKSSRYNDSPSLQRTQSLGKMVHALPPKPVVALPPPAHSPPTQNTLASTMVRRERKSNGHGKLDPGSQGASSLPPDWEERYPRDGSDRGPYYYNIKTHISTWVHPGLSPATASQDNNKNSGNTPGTETQPPGYSDAEDRASTSPRLGKRRSSPAGPLSYEDRHYRPNGDTAVTGPSKSVDRRDLLSTLPPRPVSPRPANSRRDSRVSSPPPRQDSIDQERGVRSRRDRSPLPDDGRDKSREYIQLSAEDRTWIPTRNDSPPSLPAGRNSDSRSKALRGRRDRSLLELPPQSIALSQGVRNDNEWTASSTLSASSTCSSSRVRHLYSSRGGRRLALDCLEKPRGLSCIVYTRPLFKRLTPVPNVRPRIVDSFIFYFQFVSSLCVCVPFRS
ncbi:hypothetical protein BDY19DRAFT_161001 [Irpex rosettiformis]|uniref:Uncharacterized protein n=1 Tax=Irpex rosettiformis TaxID=378272 RepID=A0ACB8U4V5_9APHY|nr:hypothetical protein BDY19DRAFT_161001 [Irpex rosettiformis]